MVSSTRKMQAVLSVEKIEKDCNILYLYSIYMFLIFLILFTVSFEDKYYNLPKNLNLDKSDYYTFNCIS